MIKPKILTIYVYDKVKTVAVSSNIGKFQTSFFYLERSEAASDFGGKGLKARILKRRRI